MTCLEELTRGAADPASFLIILECARSEAGLDSVLEGPTMGDLPGDTDRDRALDDVMLKPVGSVAALLQVWQKCQGSTITGFVVPVENQIGRPSYRYLPPRWLTPDDLNRAYPEDERARGVPVVVNSALAGHIPQFLTAVQLAQQMQGLLSTCGNAADVSVIRQATERAQSEAVSIVGSEGSIFRREGQLWYIVYAGKRISLNHSDGLTYIAYLLERPNTPLHVRELYSIAHPPDIRAQPNPYVETHKEDLAEDDLYMDGGYSPTDKRDDAELFPTYRESLADLERDLAEAQSNGDSENADELQTKLDDLKRLMAAEFGLDGSPRRPGDPNKQAYDRVSKAINAVKKRIQEHHQPLSAHLASIHYDTYTYTYSPEVPVDWET